MVEKSAAVGESSTRRPRRRVTPYFATSKGDFLKGRPRWATVKRKERLPLTSLKITKKVRKRVQLRKKRRNNPLRSGGKKGECLPKGGVAGTSIRRVYLAIYRERVNEKALAQKNSASWDCLLRPRSERRDPADHQKGRGGTQTAKEGLHPVEN